jgi:hypothetical protein
MKRALVLLTFVLTTAFAPVANAAPATWQSVDVTLHEEQGHSVIIITGVLPESTRLPAQVQLTAPSGSPLMWAGEILGTGIENDVRTEPKKTDGDGHDVYTFTLTKSRVGQIEVEPASITRFDGQTYATVLKWTPPSDLSQVRVSARIPVAAKITQGTPGAEIFTGDAQGNYYSKTFAEPKADEPLELAFTYALAAPPTGEAAAGGSTGPALTIVFVVAAALFALAFVAIRRKMAPSAAMLDADEDEEEDRSAAAMEAFLADATAAGSDSALVEEGAEEHDFEPPKRSRLPLALTAGVLGVLLIFGIVAGNRSTTAQVIDGVVRRSFGTGDACTQASIAIVPNDGIKLERSADAVLKSLEGIPGITYANLYVDEKRVEIGYCDSSANEAMLAQALASSGLVTVAD